MTQPSFLSRKTFGLPNYFLVALGFAVLVALVPRAAREALHSNTNRAEDWLPQTYTESSDLRWFRRHFISEGFVLVTWEGCTLGNAEKVNLLQEKLSSRLQDVEPETVEALKAKKLHTGNWFRKIISGPSMLRELTEPPLSLSYAEAVKRLEGALIGPPTLDAEGNSKGDDTRVTALVVYLAPEGYETNRAMREVVDEIERVAVEECGVPKKNLHMGGPTVDNVTIDDAGKGNFRRLAALSGLVGLAIAYWCFRDLALTGMVVAVGAVSAAMSLAFVFYYGVVEVVLGGMATPKYGRMDAVMMSMPPLVYVLGLSGAIHLVNYYRDARVEGGLKGAAERACRMAWTPCSLAALTTALGLGSLVVSDITPIKKFGGFSAISVLAAIVVLFTLLPVYLHRFPPKRIGKRAWKDIPKHDVGLPPWGSAMARWLTGHSLAVSVVCILTMVVVGFGITKLQSSIQLLKLLDEKSDLIQDYAWAEEHLGNLVPMEVVITLPPEQLRSAEEHAEEDDKQYRMTMLERLALIRRLQDRVESLPEVSRTLSVSTYAPEESQNVSAAVRRGNDYTVNKNLQENRESFRDYLQHERTPDGQVLPSGRELWRLSARVTALQDIDYGQFDGQLREEIEPVLVAYRQRDHLVRALHEAGKKLEGARLCILFEGPADENKPADNSPEGLLADLLRESGVTNPVDGNAGSLAFYNLTKFENPELSPEDRAQTINAVVEALRTEERTTIVATKRAEAAVSRIKLAASSPVAAPLANEQQDPDGGTLAQALPLVDLVEPPVPPFSAAIAADVDEGPRTIRSMYTGIIPLVFKTQRQLLVSLQESIEMATLLIAALMAVLLRSVRAGLVAMLPNLFPICMVFGALGWAGYKIDIGIMMTASVALGVAVDNTLHLLTWVRNGLRDGLDRRAATLLAYDRCAVAMVQSAMVGGLGLLVFATATFTPTQQFGYLMVTILGAALVGDTIMLPAIIVSPLGKCFEPRIKKIDSGSGPGPGGGQEERAAPTGPGQGIVACRENAASENGGPSRRPKPESTPVASAAESDDRTPDERVVSDAAHPDPPRPKDPRTAELNSPANAELRDRLRSFRRPSPHDPTGSR
jgi:predicted RND superfamily exporter protein